MIIYFVNRQSDKSENGENDKNHKTNIVKSDAVQSHAIMLGRP